MRDKLWIIAGLFLFLGFFSYPAWRGLAERTTPKPPDLVMPAHAKQCVAPLKYMQSSHMKLLMQWRRDVVLHNQYKYVSYTGKVYNISLTGTCLSCHQRKTFCARCHNYVGIRTPNCWSCHVDPALANRSAQ